MNAIFFRSALTLVWLALLLLTAVSLAAGEWFYAAGWLPLLVAALIWVKGTLVARYFIETPQAHPFIVWLLRLFIAFAALALLITSYFPATLARWTTIF
jgi:uncharacterized membrane protein YoaK (UPF0700 family)